VSSNLYHSPKGILVIRNDNGGSGQLHQPKKDMKQQLNFRSLLKIPITVHTKITEKSTKECLKTKNLTANNFSCHLSHMRWFLLQVSPTRLPSSPHIPPVNRHRLLSEPKIALIKCYT